MDKIITKHKTNISTLRPVNGKCARCQSILEKRNLKYDSERSEISNYVYFNCVFCGQDYYLNKCA